MGKLDEAGFDAAVKPCPACAHTVVEIHSFIDRTVEVMLEDPNDEGKWSYDGEKFVDGTYRIECVGCANVIFEDDACPRCHADGGLERALADETRLTVPGRCPSCDDDTLLALALIPSKTRYQGERVAPPEPTVDYEDPGYHIVAYACGACDEAVVSQACPLCDAPKPLRRRP